MEEKSLKMPVIIKSLKRCIPIRCESCRHIAEWQSQGNLNTQQHKDNILAHWPSSFFSFDRIHIFVPNLSSSFLLFFVQQLTTTELRRDPNYAIYYNNWTRLAVLGIIPAAMLIYFNYKVRALYCLTSYYSPNKVSTVLRTNLKTSLHTKCFNTDCFGVKNCLTFEFQYIGAVDINVSHTQLLFKGYATSQSVIIVIYIFFSTLATLTHGFYASQQIKVEYQWVVQVTNIDLDFVQ